MLTCTSYAPDIAYYEFIKDSASLGKRDENMLTISSAAIDVDEGSYTCVLHTETVASDESDPHVIRCK